MRGGGRPSGGWQAALGRLEVVGSGQIQHFVCFGPLFDIGDLWRVILREFGAVLSVAHTVSDHFGRLEKALIYDFDRVSGAAVMNS